MKQHLLLAVPVILVVIMSGCTAPGLSTGTGSGVVIEAFEPDFTNVYINEPVNFQIRVRNTGSFDTPGGKIRVLGLDDWAGEISDITVPGLIAPDATMGTAGESFSTTVTVNAPSVSQGLSVDYKPSIRVAYGYASDTAKSITLISQNELRAIQSRGSALPAETTSTSKGPIAVSITTKGPIRYWEDLNKVTFPLEIQITNGGGGVACVGGSGRGDGCDKTDNWNKVGLRIRGVDLEDECSGYGDVSTDVSLWRGQSNTITCQASFDVSELLGPTQKVVKAETVYSYFIDASTAVKVNWRETAA
jgi:hypothetical protein